MGLISPLDQVFCAPWKHNQRAMGLTKTRHDWADDEDLDETTIELPPPQKVQNKDGTTTIIEYRFNENGQKVKTTRRIRFITHREVVNSPCRRAEILGQVRPERQRPSWTGSRYHIGRREYHLQA